MTPALAGPWRRLLPCCLAVLAFWAASGAVCFADRYALIVGNNTYPNFSEKFQLRGAEADAQLMRSLLIARFQVPRANIEMVLGKKATRKGILKGLDSLFARSKPGDSLLFYYSGHGAQVRDEDGDEDRLDEVLCPHDFKFTGGRADATRFWATISTRS